MNQDTPLTHARRLENALVVEDDDDHAALLEFVLSTVDPDLELSRVEDGQQAIDRILTRGVYKGLPLPDIVFLDLKLPRVDGLGVLEAVRAEESARCLPIVMLTTSNASQDRQRAYERGVNSYLVKPMAFQDLEEMMGDALRYWGRWNNPAPRPETSYRAA